MEKTNAKRYEYILFDLDGTLIDSEKSVTESVKYALQKKGIIETDRDKLRLFIGPPLEESFRLIYGFTKEEALKSLEDYRYIYSRENIFKVELYPGICETIAELAARGFYLGIASSKPLPMVERILKHFELYGYFEGVFAATLDGRISHKDEVMAEALKAIGKAHPDITRDKIILVGDRKYDVNGAAKYDIDCAGVTYGFAVEGELEAAGAAYIINDPKELLSVAQNG